LTKKILVLYLRLYKKMSEKFGMMNKKMFVPKNELLNWINDLLEVFYYILLKIVQQKFIIL
jgi:hypothetical protein